MFLSASFREIATTAVVGLLTAFTLGGAMFMVIWPRRFTRAGSPFGPARARLVGIAGLVIFACLGWSFFFGR